jgi:hypothetical protein
MTRTKATIFLTSGLLLFLSQYYNPLGRISWWIAVMCLMIGGFLELWE